MIRYITTLTLLFIVAVPAFGQAGAFTRMGFGARGVALSNALVADAFGDASPFYNPALAPTIRQQSLEATAALLTLDRELQFLQFSAPLKPRAGIAAGLIHAGVSNIDGRDESGYHTRNYATDEFAFFLAFGVRLGERLTGGFGFQLFRADYFDDLDAVNSIGLDVGLTAEVTDAFHLGVAVDDLLARYSWNTSEIYGDEGGSTSDRFPTRFRFGAAYGLMNGRARLLAEYESRLFSAESRVRDTEGIVDTERIRLHDGLFRLGGEYQVAEPFALRAGVDQLGTGTVKPSAGFMVQQPIGNLHLRAEYAFMLETYDTQPMHFISLRVFL